METKFIISYIILIIIIIILLIVLYFKSVNEKDCLTTNDVEQKINQQTCSKKFPCPQINQQTCSDKFPCQQIDQETCNDEFPCPPPPKQTGFIYAKATAQRNQDTSSDKSDSRFIGKTCQDICSQNYQDINPNWSGATCIGARGGPNTPEIQQNGLDWSNLPEDIGCNRWSSFAKCQCQET